MFLFELNCSAVPLGPSQLLLRGAILKNTRWVFGMYLYNMYSSWNHTVSTNN